MPIGTQELLRIALELADLEEVPSDSGVHVPSADVHKIYAAIDVSVGDLLLARELGADCVLVHHPTGPQTVDGWSLMRRHVDQMTEAGVPQEKAVAIIQARMASVQVANHGKNYGQLVQAAALLGLSFLNIHLPADILARRTIAARLTPLNDLGGDAMVANIVAALEDVPEQKWAATRPLVPLGRPLNPAGRIVVSMANYASGGVDMLEAYLEVGVGTLVTMHFPDGDLREALKRGLDARGNLVLTGHMVGDSIGMNAYLDALEHRRLQVIRAGGLITPPPSEMTGQGVRSEA